MNKHEARYDNDYDGLQTRRHRLNAKAACRRCNGKKKNVVDVVKFQRDILGSAPRCLNVITIDENNERDCLNDAVVSEFGRAYVQELDQS